MKTIVKALMVLVALAGLAVPRLVLAQGSGPEDRTILGGNYTLAAGETLGNLDVVGGDVLLMAGSRVEQVYLYGGTLIINGEVQADIHALGGQLTLGDTARVGGDISLIGGNLERALGAQVDGQVSTGIASPFSLRLPRLGN
ncbi:MAG: polymer-forming cytoskeletal protein, partial [Anaerolineales bacterium]